MNILPVLHPLFHSFSLFKRKSLVAFDINNESIRLSVFTRKKKTLKLIHHLTHILPQGCVSQHRIVDKRLFVEALSHMATQITSIKSYPLIMAIPVNQVKMKTLTLAFRLSKKEIDSHVQREINTIMGSPETRIVWDHRIVDKSQKPCIEILIAQRSTLLPYQEAFSEAGLSIDIIDTESEALIRAWRFCYPDLHEAILLLARSQLLTLIFIKKDGSIFNRTQIINQAIPFNRALAEALQSLWESLSPDIIPSIKIWICGEKAETAESFFKQKIGNSTVSKITLPDKVSGHNNIIPSELFLSIGLSLHEDDE